MPARDAAVLGKIAQGKSAKEACKAAGLNLREKSAEVMVEHLRDKHVGPNGALTEALRNAGVTMDKIALTMADGLEANDTIISKASGAIVSVPNHSVRHKYMESAIDILGGRAPTKQIVEEIKTHESVVAVVEGLRANPEAITLLRERIEQRRQRVISTAAEPEPDTD